MPACAALCENAAKSGREGLSSGSIWPTHCRSRRVAFEGPRPASCAILQAGCRSRVPPPGNCDSIAQRFTEDRSAGKLFDVSMPGSQLVDNWISIPPGLWLCLHRKRIRDAMFAALTRCRLPADPLADIARIHNEAYRNDAAFRSFTTAEMAHELRGYELWIARDDARVLGFCQIEREAALIWLESVAVDPNFQRSGLGTALLYRVMQNAQLSNNHPAALNVSSKNPRAIAVYERLGFVKHQETQRFSAPRSDLVAAMARREKE